MSLDGIAVRRLGSQQLAAPAFSTPEKVVGWMGAVQAQEYAFAKWALGMRLRIDIDDAGIEQAFNAGRILRTHVMRPTWHFVLPEDVRWMLALTASRVVQAMASRYRQLEIDDDLLKRSFPVIERALQGGQQLTRKELGTALGEAGISAQGERLGHVMVRAELEALICSGPRIGKQFTYMLLDERAPHAKALPRDEALALLTQRYFQSHAPATAHDFAWWSGLTVADAKAGLEMLRPRFVPEEIGRKEYWHDASTGGETKEKPLAVHLLPVLDELANGYTDYSPFLEPVHAGKVQESMPAFGAFYTVNGRAAGMWKRTLHKDAVHITTLPFRDLSAAEGEALALAAGCFGDFLDRHVVLS